MEELLVTTGVQAVTNSLRTNKIKHISILLLDCRCILSMYKKGNKLIIIFMLSALRSTFYDFIHGHAHASGRRLQYNQIKS